MRVTDNRRDSAVAKRSIAPRETPARDALEASRYNYTERFYADNRWGRVAIFLLAVAVFVPIPLIGPALFLLPPDDVPAINSVILLAILPAAMAGLLIGALREYRCWREALVLTSFGSIAVGLEAIRQIGESTDYMLSLEAPFLIFIGAFFVSGLPFWRVALTLGIVFGIILGVESYATTFGGEERVEVFSTTLFIVLLLMAGMLYEHANRRKYAFERQLREQALRDPRTNLLNLEGLQHYYPRVFRQAHREQAPLTLAFLDLDHFKALNDRHGHLHGDRALERVAARITEFTRRPLDLAVRYGGEEFLLVWFDSDAERAPRIGGELIAAVRDLAIEHRDSPDHVHLTASAGVVQGWVMSPDEGIEEWLQAADTALYEAKSAGRDCAVYRPMADFRSERRYTYAG